MSMNEGFMNIQFNTRQSKMPTWEQAYNWGKRGWGWGGC